MIYQFHIGWCRCLFFPFGLVPELNNLWATCNIVAVVASWDRFGTLCRYFLALSGPNENGVARPWSQPRFSGEPSAGKLRGGDPAGRIGPRWAAEWCADTFWHFFGTFWHFLALFLPSRELASVGQYMHRRDLKDGFQRYRIYMHKPLFALFHPSSALFRRRPFGTGGAQRLSASEGGSRGSFGLLEFRYLR